MADAPQHSIESVSHGSLGQSSGWESTMLLEEGPADQGFESKAKCPICLRGDVLLQIGSVTFCAACGYTSDSAVVCT